MNRAGVVLGILAVAVACTVSPAVAHGVLRSSSPSAGSSLPTAPRQVDLTFNEPIDRVFSGAVVVDRAGTKMSGQVVVSVDGRRMTVPLNDLSAGVHTVRWRVLSAVDGHTTSGFFTFAVAAPAAAILQPAPAPAPGATEVPPPPLLVAMRWLAFAAAIVLAGTSFYLFFVIRPAAAAHGPLHGTALHVILSTMLYRLSGIAAIVLLSSMSMEFLLQAAIVLDTSAAGVVRSGLLWLLLGGTKTGWSLIIRGAMAVILVLPSTPAGRILRGSALVWFVIVATVSALLGGPAAMGGTHAALIVLVATVYGLLSVMAAVIVPKIPDLRPPEGNWVGPLAAGILLAGITVSSHAVGSGPVAVVIDWLHLAAASVWVGGLIPLLLTLLTTQSADRVVVARAVVPRFSGLAGISIVALAITGIYSAWIHVPSLRALIETAYGRTLVVKLALFVPLILLAALNRFVFRPRIERGASADGPVRSFMRGVSTEVALGLAVLLAVAALTITPPASVTAPASAKPGVVLAGLAGDLQVRLSVIPADAGTTQFEAVVTDARGLPVDSTATVQLHLTRLDTSEPPTVLQLSYRGEGRFESAAGRLPEPAWWEVTVTVLRGNRTASTAFPLRTGGPARGPSDPAALRLLDQVRRTMQTILSWREDEQITDGAGNVILTRYEVVLPDRIRYRTSAGTEAIIIGATRYLREGAAPWVKDTIPQPLALGGPYLRFLEEPRAAALGRQEVCGAETCQVVLWESADGTASFAARIGATINQVHSLLMVAPSHYMTSRPRDFNAPMVILPP